MRADRLISVLLMLQIHGAMTAEELSARLEISKRTIYRDIEALCRAGIPVYARPGNEGGFWLDDDYRFPLKLFTRAEMQALVVSGSSGPLQDLGLGQASQDLYLKLLASLPGMLREEAGRARQRLFIDPEGWFDTQEPMPLLPVLQQAVLQDEVLQITYQHGDGSLSERVIDAFALVCKGGAWYLLGRPAGTTDLELRTYRVARVQSASATGQSFSRPAEFDLPAYWTEHTRDFVQSRTGDRVPFEAIMRVRERSLWVFIQNLSGQYTRESEEELPGWITLRVRFEDRYPARMKALALGVDVEVLWPEDFRAEITDLLNEMAVLYSRVASTGREAEAG